MKKIIYIIFLIVLLMCACSKRSPTASGQGDTSTKFSTSSNIQPSQSSQSTPPTTAKPYKYEVRSSLHAKMPEYRFEASGVDVFVTGLDVYNEKGKSILTVAFKPEDCPVYPEMMDTMGMHVTDVNFDGYKDVIILNCFAGAHGNSWYDCWLWNAKKSTFIHSKSFINICNPALDKEKRCIYSMGGSGAYVGDWFIYKFIGGEFVVSNSLLPFTA